MLALLELYDQEKKAPPVLKPKKKIDFVTWRLENLSLDKRIGIGTYSRVFSAHSVNNGEECAIKILDDLSNHESNEYQKRMIPALNLCSNRSHSCNVPEIYRFEDRMVWKGNSQLHQIIIIMEKASCSLADIHREKIKVGSPWTEDHLIRILLSVCNALSEGMKRDLCHFDIHERNILVNVEESLFLLGDFGVPKILKRRLRNQPYESDYLAPESKGIKRLRDSADKYKADVYSLGLVILKLLALRDTFKVEDRVHIDSILEEKKQEYPLIYKILKEQMLIEDPSKRDNFMNVRFLIMTVNFDIGAGKINLRALLPKKRSNSFNFLEAKEDMKEIIDIAQAYEYFHFYDRAKQEYNRALVALQKYDDFSRENAEMRTICLARTGLIHLETLNYQAALETFNKLHDYIRAESVRYQLGVDHPLHVYIYQYIGVTYYSLNDLDKAMVYFKLAHDNGQTVLVDSELNEKMCELYIGIVRFLKKDFMGSLKEMVHVADFITKLPQKDQFDNVESLLMIGSYYRKLRAHKDALQVYAKAKELLVNDEEEESDEYIQLMTEIAQTEKELNNFKNSCNIQLSVIEKIRHSGDKKQFAYALMELADTLNKQGKSSDSIYTAEMAFKVFNKLFWLKHQQTVNAYKYLMQLLEKHPDHNIYKQYKILEDLMIPEGQSKWTKR